MNTVPDVTWLGHASFFFTDTSTGKKIYYVDPFELKVQNLPKADLVFITHAHYDHFSPQDIQKIIKNDTTVIATSDVLKLTELPEGQLFSVEPNNIYTVKDFSFQTVPAYNIKPERLAFHPQENKWVGYILTINGKKMYHMGDTDYIPEMNDFKEYNLYTLFIPIGGTYTMDVQEAIDAANAISAKITVPMHYKKLLGEKAHSAEEQFKNGVQNSEVVFLEELK